MRQTSITSHTLGLGDGRHQERKLPGPSNETTGDAAAQNYRKINPRDNFSDFDFLSTIKTPTDMLNKRLKQYQGCNVVNLSSHQLAPQILKTLSYGLSFCHTPQKASKPPTVRKH